MMKKIALGFDDKEINFDLHDENVDVILPNLQSTQLNAADLIKNAFNNPLFSENKPNLLDFSNQSIAIAINDQTRPLPHNVMLPFLIDYFVSKGAKTSKISFYIATGTHRRLTESELATVLPGKLAKDYAHHCHDCDDTANLAFLGNTSRHTPVYANRAFHQSGLKIVVGSIEPHHFMGFSGGMKTAAIGLTGHETIQKNHSMLPDPFARMCFFTRNPMRMDVEEIGCMIGVDYAFNVILNDEKQIVNAFWGDPYRVMEMGIPCTLNACQLDVAEADCRYDLVIASAGGYPKDINLYQAQKAITNACLFSKSGGVIILAAGCRDGAGNTGFVEYMRDKTSWENVLSDFPVRPFEIGPHKAYLLALQAKDHHIILVSHMPDEEVRRCLLTPARDIQEALGMASEFLPKNHRTAVLPFATHSIPKMERGE